MVARRNEVASSSRNIPPITRIHAHEQTPRADAPPSHLMPPRDQTTTALQDSLHYLFFMARHHLCHLLDAPPLAWDDTIPPPVVPQAVAREAVKSVVKGVALARATREEGWEAWDRAFDPTETVEDLKRGELEGEMLALWASAVGRPWEDGSAGEQVCVELEYVQSEIAVYDAEVRQRSILHAASTTSASNVINTSRSLDPLSPPHNTHTPFLIRCRARIPHSSSFYCPIADSDYPSSSSSRAGPGTSSPSNPYNPHVCPCTYGLLCTENSRYAMDVD